MKTEKVKSLVKRSLAAMMCLAMLGMSVDMSALTVYAEPLQEETAESIQKDVVDGECLQDISDDMLGEDLTTEDEEAFLDNGGEGLTEEVEAEIITEDGEEILSTDEEELTLNSESEDDLAMDDDEDVEYEILGTTGGTISNPVHYHDAEGIATDYTTWSYVYFGAYPQSKVTDDTIISQIDTALASKPSGTKDVVIDGTKYRRISRSDTNNSTYFGSSTYRYFKWEKIKWRVLHTDGSKAFLVADKGLDCEEYNETSTSITWENSTIRSYLNNSFMNRAFTSSEQAAIKSTTVVNDDNPDYRTEGGNNTTDKIFLLSIDEVQNEDYGFCAKYNCYSVSRQMPSTPYSHAMGASENSSSFNDGIPCVSWWLRSPGNDVEFAALVDDFGQVNRSGNDVTYKDKAAVPALYLDLSYSDLYSTEDNGATFDEDPVLFVEDIKSQTYTGSAIKPEVNVYYGDELLKKGTDYTVTYKNNVNAYTLPEGAVGFNAAKAPTAVITMKGNFSGSKNIFFTINPKDISKEGVTVSDISSITYNSKKDYKPVPTVTFGNKKLAVNKDFTIKYYDSDACKEGTEVNPKDAKPYWAKLTGKGNYTGEVKKTFTIETPEKVFVSKLKIGKLPSRAYTGSSIEFDDGVIVVKDGKNPLIQGVEGEDEPEDYDYSVEYSNNVEVGTATVTIKGSGAKYIGSRKVTFSITGTPLNKVTITGFKSSLTYNGEEVKQDKEALTLTYTPKGGNAKTVKCEEKSSYEESDSDTQKEYGAVITYSNNSKAGTATMILTGVNGYTGTVKKTFKITPYVISATDSNYVVTVSDSAAYEKSGAKPKITVKFKETTLTEGKDYTLAYSNNKAVNDGTGKKKPTVTIKGKGNFKGSMAETFRITARDIADGSITVTAPDKVYAAKKGAWKAAVTVADNAGKILKAKTDYEASVVYKYETVGGTVLDGSTKTPKELETQPRPGDIVEANHIVPAGSKIKVEITGKGNYTETLDSCVYRIVNQDIGKLKISVATKTFTGKPVNLKKEDITFESGKTKLDDVTFEIVEGSYKNNINKGKASVVIRGTGNYGGTKTITFNIGQRKFLLW